MIQQEVPVEVQQILDDYSIIFKEPEGLPPKRECDHQIRLKAEATPPNSRAKRVPHLKRNELEKQVDELLKSRIIRASQSSYSSTAILVMKKDGT